MKEAKGDIFTTHCDAVCITTNGFVKSNGECVMGRGCALKAAQLNPEIPRTLGKFLTLYGNRVFVVDRNNGVDLVTYPVKPVSKIMQKPEDVVAHMRNKFRTGDSIPGWACIADLEILERSARQLVALASKKNYWNVVLPRPGCGAGELTWDEVKPVLAAILDDRFTCMTF